MNIMQRIVLILGAIALLLVMASTESHRYYRESSWNTYWDWKSASVRAVIVSMVTIAIYFSCRKKKDLN